VPAVDHELGRDAAQIFGVGRDEVVDGRFCRRRAALRYCRLESLGGRRKRSQRFVVRLEEEPVLGRREPANARFFVEHILERAVGQCACGAEVGRRLERLRDQRAHVQPAADKQRDDDDRVRSG
jgi:hypothetical protein